MELGRHSPSCSYIEPVRRQQQHIEIMVTIVSQEIDERQDTCRLNCQEHELVEMFSRCLKLGFNQQEVERAALRVLNKTGTSSPTLLLLLDDLLRDRGSTVQFGDNETCKVCRKDVVNTIFLPCGHKLTCSKCASEIQKCLQISCGERVWGYYFE